MITVSSGVSVRISASIDSVAIGSSDEVGSSSSSTSGLDGQRPGQAQQLLLAAGQPERGVLEPGGDRVPQPHLGQPLLGDLQLAALLAIRCAFTPATTLSMIDMGNGFGRWNSMPTLRRSAIRSTAGCQMLLPSSSTSPWCP